MTTSKGISEKDRGNALVVSYLSERGISKLIDECDKSLATLGDTDGSFDLIREIDTLELSFVSNYTSQSETDLSKLSLSIFDRGPISILVTDNFRNEVGKSINKKVQLHLEDFNSYGVSIIGEYLEQKGNGTLRYLQLQEYFNYIKQPHIKEGTSEDRDSGERAMKQVEKYANHLIERDKLKISSSIHE